MNCSFLTGSFLIKLFLFYFFLFVMPGAIIGGGIALLTSLLLFLLVPVASIAVPVIVVSSSRIGPDHLLRRFINSLFDTLEKARTWIKKREDSYVQVWGVICFLPAALLAISDELHGPKNPLLRAFDLSDASSRIVTGVGLVVLAVAYGWTYKRAADYVKVLQKED